jgi:hypothetical protein
VNLKPKLQIARLPERCAVVSMISTTQRDDSLPARDNKRGPDNRQTTSVSRGYFELTIQSTGND